MGFVNRAFVAAGVGFAAAAIVGCGSSGGRLLSQSQASTLSGQLNEVKLALSEGQCAQAQRYLNDFQNAVNQYGGVDSTLVANLNQGANTIASLSSTECPIHPATTPKKRKPKTHTTSTTTTTVTTTSTVTPATTTTTLPPTTSTPPTVSSPNGGVGPGAGTTTTTSSTSTTTPGNGGTGLGGTVGSTGATGPTGATGTSGSGF